MKKTQEILKPEIRSLSPQTLLAQGMVENLPEIIGAIKEIYVLHKKENIYHQLLQARLSELNIHKENFKVLVQSLTELSKSEHVDHETKAMYRDMIKILFDMFADNMRSSQDISKYLNGL